MSQTSLFQYLKIHDESIDFQQEKVSLKPGTLENAHKKIVELEKQIELEKIKDINSPKIKILKAKSVYKLQTSLCTIIMMFI